MSRLILLSALLPVVCVSSFVAQAMTVRQTPQQILQFDLSRAKAMDREALRHATQLAVVDGCSGRIWAADGTITSGAVPRDSTQIALSRHQTLLIMSRCEGPTA